MERIRWWKDVCAAGRDTQINGVVSHGNEAGGRANVFEKSPGAMMKGGTGPLMGIYRDADPVTAKGFVFMDTPGFDPVSAIGQFAGGANLIAFTTGRGTMYGAKPVPSIKLTTDSPMYRRLEDDMDIGCGEILDSTATLPEMGERILDLMLHVASGEKSKSEELGLGKRESAPWQLGITGQHRLPSSWARRCARRGAAACRAVAPASHGSLHQGAPHEPRLRCRDLRESRRRRGRPAA
jgi:altronate hydrolase